MSFVMCTCPPTFHTKHVYTGTTLSTSTQQRSNHLLHFKYILNRLHRLAIGKFNTFEIWAKIDSLRPKSSQTLTICKCHFFTLHNSMDSCTKAKLFLDSLILHVIKWVLWFLVQSSHFFLSLYSSRTTLISTLSKIPKKIVYWKLTATSHHERSWFKVGVESTMSQGAFCFTILAFIPDENNPYSTKILSI